MSQEEQVQISNSQANAGSGAVGIGLGTVLVVLAPKITSYPNIIDIIQIASPSISVATAFIFKAVFNYYMKQNRLKQISKAATHIDGLFDDINITKEYRSKLVNQKEELHTEEISIMLGRNVKNLEPSSIPNKTLKRTR